jgi:hypothetical protein
MTIRAIRAITMCLAAAALAAPAGAQQRGTMEIGAFVTGASFDQNLGLNKGFGGGGRMGMYLDPRWSIEFEDAELAASRPNGLRDVGVGILSGRLVATPFRTGNVSLLLGAGAGVATETNFLHSYGVDLLAGAKFDIGSRAAFRVDAVWDWLANEDYKQYKSIRMGFVMYRHPSRVVTP